MGKKNESKRKHLSRERSIHNASQTSIPSINFTIPDHPSGVPPPLPTLLLPPPPSLPPPSLPPPSLPPLPPPSVLPPEYPGYNLPLPPSTPPRQPRPVIVRQHGLYTYHNGTPQHQPRGLVQDEAATFSEKEWPGPVPRPTKQKEDVSGYGRDPEKGVVAVDTEVVEGGNLKDTTPPSTRKRKLKCISILTLAIVLFLVVPVCIGIGISTGKKKNGELNQNGTENQNMGIDTNGLPTVSSGADGLNGLSYMDWFCGGCRCITDQGEMAKCLGGQQTNTKQ